MTVTTDKKADADQPDDETVTESEATDSAQGSETASDTEAGSEAEAEPVAEAEPDAEAAPRPRRRWLVVAAVGVAFAVLLGVSGFLGFQVWQARQLATAEQQARDAAVAYAQVLTSIDSAKVDENFNQVLDGATGEFKDMYSESSMQLRQLLIDNKAAAHGVVVESAVQSTADDRVVVLLFVDQSVTNSQVPDPRIDRSRIKMTMEKVDGRWLAAKVELA